MPGFSSRTFSRCSLAKNMYAERPRLGALGSVATLSARHSDTWARQNAMGIGCGNAPFLPLRPFSAFAPFFAAALGMVLELMQIVSQCPIAQMNT